VIHTIVQFLFIKSARSRESETPYKRYQKWSGPYSYLLLCQLKKLSCSNIHYEEKSHYTFVYNFTNIGRFQDSLTVELGIKFITVLYRFSATC